MKTLYLQCNMGAAGDMLNAALYELLSPEQKAEYLQKMNSLLEHVTVSADPAAKCGIVGTHMSVLIDGEEEEGAEDMPAGAGGEECHEHMHDHDHHDHEHHHHHGNDKTPDSPEENAARDPHDAHEGEHHHHHVSDETPDSPEENAARDPHDAHESEHHHHHVHHVHVSLADVNSTISSFDLPDPIRTRAVRVYDRLAAAESRAHGMPVAQIHFHEVGEKDAIIDVTGCCLLMSMLAPDRTVVSPVHLGSGQVRTAHGILPVPTPATAELLRGVPCYSGEVRGELITPTGAALLTEFADSFGEMPAMAITATGYGMGKKDFAAANCVRAILGETKEDFRPNSRICELMANLDDMTPETIGYAIGEMMANGALDAYVIPIVMKKNRPGHLFTVICKEEDADTFARLILIHTTSFGVRRHLCDRYMMIPSFDEVETEYGTIRRKTAEGFGVKKSKPEYEDMVTAAKNHGVPLEEVRRAFYAGQTVQKD